MRTRLLVHTLRHVRIVVILYLFAVRCGVTMRCVREALLRKGYCPIESFQMDFLLPSGTKYNRIQHGFKASASANPTCSPVILPDTRRRAKPLSLGQLASRYASSAVCAWSVRQPHRFSTFAVIWLDIYTILVYKRHIVNERAPPHWRRSWCRIATKRHTAKRGRRQFLERAHGV